MKILSLTEKYDVAKWVLKCFNYDNIFSENEIFDIIDIIGENDFKSIAIEIIESMFEEQPPKDYQKKFVNKIVDYMEESYVNGGNDDALQKKIKTLELGVESFLNKN